MMFHSAGYTTAVAFSGLPPVVTVCGFRNSSLLRADLLDVGRRLSTCPCSVPDRYPTSSLGLGPADRQGSPPAHHQPGRAASPAKVSGHSTRSPATRATTAGWRGSHWRVPRPWGVHPRRLGGSAPLVDRVRV